MAIVEAVLAQIQRDASVDHPDIDHDDNVLKIVMIPEFFWRGPHGAYITVWMVPPQTLLVDLSDHIWEIISGEFWNDFLFVFGTIITADTPGGQSSRYCILQPTTGQPFKREDRRIIIGTWFRNNRYLPLTF
jgi:hypothetical protein